MNCPNCGRFMGIERVEPPEELDIDSMSEDEVDDVLRSAGLDPRRVAERMRDAADEAYQIASLKIEVEQLRAEMERMYTDGYDAAESHAAFGLLPGD